MVLTAIEADLQSWREDGNDDFEQVNVALQAMFAAGREGHTSTTYSPVSSHARALMPALRVVIQIASQKLYRSEGTPCETHPELRAIDRHLKYLECVISDMDDYLDMPKRERFHATFSWDSMY